MSNDNIKVIIRMRPLLKFEDQPSWQIKGNTIDCLQTKRVRDKIGKSINSRQKDIQQQIQQYHFQFESAANQTMTSQKIYKRNIKDSLRKCLNESINMSIMAYGQTCSGKTYTILGVNEHPGIIPCALRDIFFQINESQHKFSIKMSYLQIYNEKIYDLLDKQSPKSLKITQDKTWGCEVTHSIKEGVRYFQESLKLLEKGELNREYAVKQNHERSSRSHTILRIFIEQWDSSFIKRSSMINIVDLAGSERINSNSQNINITETGFINKSLFQLSNVINKLSSPEHSSNKESHIPYRDSKITRLLQSSLNGQSLSFAIFCVSPAVSCFHQTLSTFRLAMKTKKIQIQKKEDIKNDSLEEKIKILNLKLEEKTKQCQLLSVTIEKLNQKIYELQRLIQRPVHAKQITNIVESKKEIKEMKEAKEIKEKYGKKLFLWGCRKDSRVCAGRSIGEFVQINNLGEMAQVSCGYHHSFVITKKGEAYGWGKNNEHQISSVSQQSIKIPIKIDQIQKIKKIVAGWAHSLALNSRGQLHSWGYGKDGQLGHGDQQSKSKPQIVDHHQLITDIFAGHSHSGFINSQNQFYAFGFNKDYRCMIGQTHQIFAPMKISISDVSTASLGINHSCLITKNGNIYAGGVGTHGELGIILDEYVTGFERIQVLDRKFSEERYQKVCPLLQMDLFDESNRAIDVKCGENVTHVLNDRRQLISFGKQTGGRTGSVNSQPSIILDNIDLIAVGPRHSIARDKHNKLYSWGFNMYGQANPTNQFDLNKPELVQLPQQQQIISLSCGFFHSAAILL